MRTSQLLVVLTILCGISVSANASLIDRGGGLIYDDDLNITWLQDANYAITSGYNPTGQMTWYEAMAWVENLVYAGYSDWRLPKEPGKFNSPTEGEMGHLYLEELKNPLGGPLTNIGPFINLLPEAYWSSTEASWSNAWYFHFSNNFQNNINKNFSFLYAMAVRDGDVISGPKEVTIDIKPDSDPNSINLSSAGVLPVAILSSDTFDATTANPATISLAGAKVKMVGKSNKYLCHQEDVNSDGLIDLVCQIKTAELMIKPGESIGVLEAQTFDGTPIRGEDTVRIVP